MLSSYSNPMSNQPYSKRSIVSSPFTYQTSSVAARGSAFERQRLIPANPRSTHRNDVVVEEGDDDEEEDAGDDEDGSGLTPLLPIFEAAQLGNPPNCD
jgi:hypothetical protein